MLDSKYSNLAVKTKISVSQVPSFTGLTMLLKRSQEETAKLFSSCYEKIEDLQTEEVRFSAYFEVL